MTESPMQLTDVRAALDRYYSVLDSREPSGFIDVVSPDIVFEDDALRRAPVQGPDAFLRLFTGIWRAFPDLHNHCQTVCRRG